MAGPSRKEARGAVLAASMIAGIHARVVGTGLTKFRGAWAVKVNLAGEPVDRALLPHSVNGVAVVYGSVGDIMPLDGARNTPGAS